MCEETIDAKKEDKRESKSGGKRLSTTTMAISLSFFFF